MMKLSGLVVSSAIKDADWLGWYDVVMAIKIIVIKAAVEIWIFAWAWRIFVAIAEAMNAGTPHASKSIAITEFIGPIPK